MSERVFRHPVQRHIRGACLRPMARWTIIAAPLFVGTPSLAAAYATRDVGPWTVTASSDETGCFLTRTYDGPRATTLQFGLDADGGNRLTVMNANWSIRAKERLKLNFRLSGAAFPRHLAIGIAAGGQKGFVASFGTDFVRTFATSRFLHVSRGAVPVEELDLDGSGAAVTELRKCVDLYRGTRAPAPSGKQGKSRIPADPFAAKAGDESRK